MSFICGVLIGLTGGFCFAVTAYNRLILGKLKDGLSLELNSDRDGWDAVRRGK